MHNSPGNISDVRAKDIMVREVLTVGSDLTVAQAVGLLIQHGISGFPVTDHTGRLLGIISDYLLLNVLYQPELGAAQVSTIMTKQVITVDEDTPIAEVARTLVENGIRRVPVVCKEKLVGIISREDLIRCANGLDDKPSRFFLPNPPSIRNSNRANAARILVADDSAVMHSVIRDTLSRSGYQLDFTFSGEDLLSKVEEALPDLILLDRLMPGLDGMSVLRQLQKTPETSAVPVIMVTSCDRPEHVAEALASGAVDFVNKPFSTLELQSRVAAALRAYCLQRDLKAERVKAEATAQAKSEFLANMSHEIRTPMTAILGFADILAGNLCKPGNVDAANTILRNADYLLEIVDDILDVSKLEAGKLTINRMDCSVALLVADVASLMRARADDKGLTLQTEYVGPIPETVQTDPIRLRQILINLMGNAIKFTEDGGVRLMIRLVQNGRSSPQIRFDVIDTGIGMTQHDMKKLFKPFSQAESSAHKRHLGTGLGLTISRRLTEMLGGDITVDSTPDKGSTFTVTIETGPLGGVPMLDNPYNVVAEGKQNTKSSPATQFKLEGRILLAEDGPDNQRLIRFLLEKAGAFVALAENGQTACEMAIAAHQAGEPFDVILMDMQMPIMDGYDATRQLRQQGYASPIVALTASAMTGDREKCLQAGCDGFATKPIDLARLCATLNPYLGVETIPAV